MSLALAARNIAADVAAGASARRALLLTSTGKAALAHAVARALQAKGYAAEVGVLDVPDQAATARLHAALAQGHGLGLLCDPPQAAWLFEALGRPDRGLRWPRGRFFCDWLLSLDGLLRTQAIDRAETARLRQRLLADLIGAAALRLTTPAGTDLILRPRHWIAEGYSEVCTAPWESLAEGTVVVDGCAYFGPPRRPFALRLAAGRVINLDDLDRDDPQQSMAWNDLCRDAGAAVLCELGLGINPSARPDADLMEAEQARGGCHLGFGHNLPLGGANASATHVDFVLLAPRWQRLA